MGHGHNILLEQLPQFNWNWQRERERQRERALERERHGTVAIKRKPELVWGGYDLKTG